MEITSSVTVVHALAIGASLVVYLVAILLLGNSIALVVCFPNVTCVCRYHKNIRNIW